MVWDKGVKGLHVLVSPGGARTYRSLYYYAGSSKPHSRKLGRVGVMSLDQARKLCLADQKAAREGIDPLRDEPSRSDAFEAVVNEYIDREQVARKSNATAEEARRILLKDCAAFGHRPIASIRIGEIEDLLERVRDGDAEHRARPYLAVKLWGHLGSLFRWCVRKRKLAASPMLGIDRPWEGAKSRDRVYSDSELKKLWTCDTRTAVAANGDKVQFNPSEGAYLKLLILTGKRKTALADMRWGEIDENWNWTPPPGKPNKQVHPLPLPKLAQRILLGLKPKDAKPDDFVFTTNCGSRFECSICPASRTFSRTPFATPSRPSWPSLRYRRTCAISCSTTLRCADRAKVTTTGTTATRSSTRWRSGPTTSSV